MTRAKPENNIHASISKKTTQDAKNFYNTIIKSVVTLQMQARP